MVSGSVGPLIAGARPGQSCITGLEVLTVNGLIGQSGDNAGHGSWMLHDRDAGASLLESGTLTIRGEEAG